MLCYCRHNIDVMKNKSYKDFACELAYAAGKIMRDHFAAGVTIEWKAEDTPVTAADRMINALVIESIKKEFPDHRILAEEGNDLLGGSEYLWVCDPLDGTMPFAHGVPVAAFSLALTLQGRSILGVIYDPFMDRLFVAERGKGAFLNGEKISVSSAEKIKEELVCVLYWKDAQFDFSRIPDIIRCEGGRIIQGVSVAYTGALVSCGELAGTIFPGTEPHEGAALAVIVEEAGGKVTDVFGNEQRYDRPIKGHIVSNGRLHKKLLAVVQSAMRFIE